MGDTVTRKGLVSAGLVMAFAVLIFARSIQFPAERSGTPGPGIYPAFIAVCLFVLGTIQVIQTFVLEPSERDGPPISREAMKRLVVPVSSMLVYILLLPLTGFLVGTVLFLVLLMRHAQITDYWRSVPISAGVAVLLQFVFGQFLGVPLPEGVFPVARYLPGALVGGVI